METYMEDRDDRDDGNTPERDVEKSQNPPPDGDGEAVRQHLEDGDASETPPVNESEVAESSRQSGVVPVAPQPPKQLENIEVSASIRPQVILTKIVALLKSKGAFLSTSGGALLVPTVIDGTEIVQMILPGEVPSFLVNLCSFFSYGGKDGRTTYQYLPLSHAKALFVHEGVKELPQIEHVARNCAVDKNLQVLPQGYSPDCRVYLCGPVYSPRTGTSVLEEILSDFDFKDEASRANFIGALLGAMLFAYLHRQPAVSVTADGPGAGKSLLAKLLAVIVDAVRYPTTVGLNSSETEFEKILGAFIARIERVIIIDNCKGSRSRPAFSSSVLERLITDERPSTRMLGANTLIERPANLVWALTGNDSQMSPDLVSRCLPVVLRVPRREDVHYKHADLLRFAFEHRAEILGELLGMITRWRDQDAPRDKTVQHRELHWAQAIGGVLKANGIDGFLDNYKEALANQNTVTRELVTVLRELARDSRTFESLDIARRARAMRMLGTHFLPYQSDSAARSKVSVLLRGIIGVPFEFEGSRITVIRHQGRPVRYSITEEELPEIE